MTRYLGKARNVMTSSETRALVYRVQPVRLLAWAVVVGAVLWFSCCGGVP